jgi:hypothetical protein
VYDPYPITWSDTGADASSKCAPPLAASEMRTTPKPDPMIGVGLCVTGAPSSVSVAPVAATMTAKSCS